MQADQRKSAPLRRGEAVAVGGKPLRSISWRTNVSVASRRKALTTKIGVTVSAIAATTRMVATDRRLYPEVLAETRRDADSVPDRDRERHARDEEDDEHDPEPNPGALRALAMRDTRLPAGTVEAHGLLDLLVVDDGHVLRFQFTQRFRHTVKCKGRTSTGAMLHTMQPMAFHDRDIPGESLFERGIIGIGDRLGLLAGVVLAVSGFTGWY